MSKRVVSKVGGAFFAARDHKTRREALGALASVGALTIPATNPLATPVDPIFGAIERHKAACAEVNKLLPTIDEVLALLNASTVSGADWVVYERAVQSRERAFDTLLATPPTTTEGMRAAIAHALSFEDGYLNEFARPLLVALLKSPLFAAQR
jgi:hypothetical protein